MTQPKLGRVAAAAALTLALALSGCTSKAGTDPSAPPGVVGNVRANPPDGVPSADATVKSLVTALQTGKLESVPWVQDATKVVDDYKVVVGGMDGLRPTITAQPVAYVSDDKAGVQLDQTYTIGSKPWKFSSTARLVLTDGKWAVDWDPAIIHPDLTSISRLRHTRTVAQRASIIGANNMALVERRRVFRVGIDKSAVTAAEAQASATALAKVVKVDPAAFAAQVKAAGDKAFVVAITLREGQVPAQVEQIKGALAAADTMMLAPTKTFAQSILGTTGPATQEQVAKSKGAIQAGDIVGQSGLQARYDAQLRGGDGHTVTMVKRQNFSPYGAAAPDNPAADPATFVESVLFSVDPVPAKPLTLTLNLDLQTKAESVLSKQKGVAALVVLDSQTGAVLAAANSSASGANAFATAGHYPPGSTFKVASSLALLRKGMTPTSSVNCPATITIAGWTYKNYSDYPANKLGKITLTDAVANSCNTAFMDQGQKLTGDDLAKAAASLGVGVDYDSGFESFYGSVPNPQTPGEKATGMIGQGKVEASPLAMAGLAASVASGKTQIPWLVVGKRPTPTAAPLTAQEAAQLKTLMGAVVTQGSGQVLQGLVDGAKTGTAEFGTATPPKTHAWMIAFNQKYSIAAFVNEGASGSGTVGPIIKEFLGG